MTFMIVPPFGQPYQSKIIQAKDFDEAKKIGTDHYPGWTVRETETYIDPSNDCVTYRPKRI